MNRREFLDALAIGAAAGMLGPAARAADAYPPAPRFGQVRLLHLTDCHAQLLPVHYREPSVNLGIGRARGRFPHLVGRAFLEAAGITDPRLAHALTHLDFAAAARRFGKLGGFAHIRTLVDRLHDLGPDRTLLMDGGDTWQGSGTAYWTRGKDMVGASNLLGVDLMTGHWEFTYPEAEVRANLAAFHGDFVAQNVRATEDALFEGIEVFDEDSGHVFAPYTVRRVGERRVAVIGQAFPYTPIANPRDFVPNWTFGIREAELGELVARIRAREAVDAVVLLSHNGMDVDLKLAGRVSGIDAILGGHTHDAVPLAVEVDNPGGRTVVTNAGSNGKFIGVLDLEFGKTGIRDYRYRLLPVFSALLPPDPHMAALIERLRKPYLERLDAPITVSESLLYRRGNFNGTFDQVIVDALREVLGAEIGFSPGFRWGTSVLPGETVTREQIYQQTAITYPETYLREMTGAEIHFVLESVCDNLFNPDPYRQQGGDMVRVGGLTFSCRPAAARNRRIGDLRLAGGKPLAANQRYKVAGWATVAARAPGAPIWEVVTEYLRSKPRLRVEQVDQPRLIGVQDNPGLA